MKKTIPGAIAICLVLWIGFISYPSFHWFSVFMKSESFEVFKSLVLDRFGTVYLLDEIALNYFSIRTYQHVSENLALHFIVFLLMMSTCLSIIYFLYKSGRPLTIDFPAIQREHTVVVTSLIIGWIAYKVFLYHYFPLHIDEVFDFVNFSRKGLIVRHSYQFTDGVAWFNNHVLYTDFSNVFYNLGLSDKLAIRLPSVLTDALLLLLIMLMNKKRSIEEIFLIFCIFMLSFWSSIYSIQGKSYLLVAFFCLLSYFLFERFRNSKNNSYLLPLLLTISMGLGANKLFAIPCAGLFFYTLLRYRDFTRAELFLLLLVIAGSLALTILFYFPVIQLSGWNSVIPEGAAGTSKGLIALFPALLEGLSVMTNINAKAYLLFLASPMLYVIFRSRLSENTKNLLFFLVAQLAALFVYSVIVRAYLPFRAMIYLNVLFSLAVAYSLNDVFVLRSKRKTVALAICVLVAVVNTLFNFNYSWVRQLGQFVYGKELYGQLDAELDQILGVNPKRILVHKNLHFLLFYSQLRNEEKTQVFGVLPELQPGDLLIAEEPLPGMKILFKSSVDEAYVQKE